MGSSSSKSSEDLRPNSTRDLGESGNVGTDKRVFDDGVGKKTILPFFSTEPCEEVVQLLQENIPALHQKASFIISSPGCPPRILFASEDLCSKTRCRLEELLDGRILCHAVSQEQHDVAFSRIQEALNFGQELSEEFLVINNEGCQAFTHLHALPVHNKLGRLVLYVMTLANITTSDDQAAGRQKMISNADQIAEAIEEAMQWQSTLTRARRRRLERIPFPEGFVISDPWRPDNPLVWCSPDFYRLTGYCAAEILGRNCRFLQGEETDQEEIDKMRDGIKAVCNVTACFLNYRKDGSGFWNHISVYPVLDADGTCVFFSAMQYDASWLMEMLMAQGENGEAGAVDDGRMAGLERIDEVQVEVNALVRDILLDQADFDGGDDVWRLKSGAVVRPREWEAQVRATVAIGQACAAVRREFEADADAVRGSCTVWE